MMEGPLKLTKFDGDVEIPRNLIVRVVGHMLNEAVQARLAERGQKLLYPDILRQVINEQPEAGDIYVNGAQPAPIRYFLSGSGAKDLIASLRG